MAKKRTRSAPAKTKTQAPKTEEREPTTVAPVEINFIPPTDEARRLAAQMKNKWGVPAALFLIGAMKTGYGKDVKARHNHFDLQYGSDVDYRKTNGYNQFSIARDSYDLFGHYLTRKCGVNVSDKDWQDKAAAALGYPAHALRKLIDTLNIKE